MISLLRRLLLPGLAFAVLFLLLAYMAGMFRDKVEPALATLSQVSASGNVAATLVSTTVIEPVSASVEAKQATLISSRTLARITAVLVRAGDSVEQGQLLLELEKDDVLARVQQSREQIRGISARVKEASRNLKRVNELHAKGLTAAADLDKAQANKDALAAQLAGARRALQEAETAVDFTSIRSPIDGRVVDRFAEPGDTAAPGNKLLSLYNPLYLRIEARVREQLALQLSEGQALKVEVPTLNKVIDAVIEERVPAAEPGSRSLLVKARVEYDQDLLPGMYARLLVPAGSEEQVLIPADRVVQVGQLNIVWVLVNGQAQRRFIRMGRPVGADLVEVLAGVKDAELILPPAID
jgi:membrane fusion protein (multidrug efflux system)